MKRLQISTVIDVEFDDDLFTIVTKRTSRGQCFRLDHTALVDRFNHVDTDALWENDPLPVDQVTIRGKWVKTLQKAAAAAPMRWVASKPIKLDHQYKDALWQLCLTSCEGLHARELSSSHLARWEKMLGAQLPSREEQPAEVPTAEAEVILELGGEGGGYAIERVQSPGGLLFRLKSSGMGWDDDADEECWSTRYGEYHPSLDQVFAELRPKWHRLYLEAVHPDYATSIKARYLSAWSSENHYPPRNLAQWTEVLSGD